MVFHVCDICGECLDRSGYQEPIKISNSRGYYLYNPPDKAYADICPECISSIQLHINALIAVAKDYREEK